MSPMMADLQLNGSAESGYGVRLIGFHGSVYEFPKKLSEWIPPSSTHRLIAQAESNGYVLFLVSESESSGVLHSTRLATYRREPHRFFPDLGPFLKNLKAVTVLDMVLTSSLGSFTLSLLYEPSVYAEESSGG